MLSKLQLCRYKVRLIDNNFYKRTVWKIWVTTFYFADGASHCKPATIHYNVLLHPMRPSIYVLCKKTCRQLPNYGMHELLAIKRAGLVFMNMTNLIIIRTISGT